MRRFLFVVLISCLGRTAFPQAQYVSFRIDSAVRAEMQARQIPGLQIAVIKYGLVIKKGHYGYANLEDRVAVTDSTLFSISSMTRAMTCAGILLLVEDGQLALDDSVGRYLNSVSSGMSGINIRQLMNHISESPAGWDDYALENIIAKVSGQNYADFMQHRIFDKLGMSWTRLNDPEAIIPNRAAGYTLKDSVIIHAFVSSGVRRAVNRDVLTTVTDMLKWYAALQDSSLLKQSSRDLMFSPSVTSDSSKTPYGLGWLVGPYRDHPLIKYAGNNNAGFNSVIEIYPEDHVCIVVLSNLSNSGAPLIAKDIIGLFNRDYGRASLMDSVTDPDSVRTLLLKSDFTELGWNIDTTRRLAAQMHIPDYFTSDSDLEQFRNVEEFTFIKSIRPASPAPDIFGDTVQSIYLYRVKTKNQPQRYYAFFLNPEGKLIYLDREE